MQKKHDYTGVPQDAPIVRQPQAVATREETWMSIPIGIHDCPHGLEYLTAVNQLILDQQVDGNFCNVQNKFRLRNNLGQTMYFIEEDTNWCAQNIFSGLGCFDFRMLDNYQNEMLHLHKPLRCGRWCLPWWLQNLEVSSPPGTVIGSVQQEFSVLRPSFALKNAHGKVMLYVKGPVLPVACKSDIEFEISKAEGQNIGKIKSKCIGLDLEIFEDTDHFGVTFPMELDVRMKAVIMAATILIKKMYHFAG